MSRPILHGTALCPLFRFPTGARLRLKVTMASDFDLDGREIVFAARSRYAVAGARPLYRISLADSPEVWTHTSPNTVELSLAPDAADETEDSERTLADMQAGGPLMWRMDFLDAEGEWPAMRLQGDIEWIQEEGDWDDDPRSTPAIPTLNVSIVAGVATVTVALISDGATVDNASVVAAIEEDPDAVIAALGIDTTPADGSLTNAKLANMAEATFKMRAAAAGTGEPINGSNSQARTALGLATTDDVDFGGAAIGTTGICDISPGGIITFSGGGTYDQVIAVGGAYIRRDGAINAGATGYAIESGAVQPYLSSTELKMGAAGGIGFTAGSGISAPLDAYFTRHAAGVVNVHSFLRLVPTTFASLPTPATAGNGTEAKITDGATTTLGGVATGGGGEKQCLECDGTDWRVKHRPT